MSWNPFTRHERAIGLTLWKWGRRKLEIWFTPAHYSTPEHAHDYCDGKFLVLYGKRRVIWKRREGGIKDWYELTGKFINKWFTVHAGEPHGFSEGDSVMVWIVLETWRCDCQMSLSKDFRVTQERPVIH